VIKRARNKTLEEVLMVRIQVTLDFEEPVLRDYFVDSESLCKSLEALKEERPYIKSIQIDAEMYPMDFWKGVNKE
jgi:hypothetical protein